MDKPWWEGDDPVRDTTWGAAPPYGAYRGDYFVAQFGSMGSGQLGGWSAVALGGVFDDAAPDSPHPPALDPDEGGVVTESIGDEPALFDGDPLPIH